jgi:hypothetical protein
MDRSSKLILAAIGTFFALVAVWVVLTVVSIGTMPVMWQ